MSNAGGPVGSVRSRDPESAGARLRAFRGLAPTVGLGTLVGILVIVQAFLLSQIVDAAFLRGEGLAEVTPLLLGLAAAAVAKAAAGGGQEIVAQRYSASVRRDVRDRLVRRLLALGPRHAAGEQTGELTNTLVGGVEALDAYLSQYQPQIWLAAIAPLLVLMAVLWADPLSALVLVLTYPLIPLFMWLIGAMARERTRRQWMTLSRLSARFLDALQGLATLRAFGRADDAAESVARTGERYREVTMSVLRLAFLSALVLELLAMLGTAIVAVEVGLRLLYGRVAFDQALFALVLAPEFYRPLRALGAAFHAGMAGKEASARIAEVLSLPGPFVAPALLEPRRVSGPSAVDSEASGATALAPQGPPSIEFCSVRFSYNPLRPAALDGLTLSIGSGQTVALVGPTGAGKTTVGALLLRFLDPEGGTILVDGRPLGDRSPEQWRRHVAWVPQRPRLFHGSLRDNVLLARPDASPAELDDAAALAHIDTLVRELPQEWETPVGEGGERLSGGEAQRVALARAFLKDAPVLVLDEPTVQLDPEGEAAILDSISRLRRGRTVLLIAHRLTTVFGADRIVLLQQGRTVEAGTHRELLDRGRLYPRLVAAWGGTA